LKPPLNNDFFKMAKKVIDSDPGWLGWGGIVGLDHLVGNINRLYGYTNSEDDTAVFEDSRLTLESVMNYFYLERQLLDPYPNSTMPKVHRIETLNELLANVLSESLKGPPCTKHARLASLMQARDVVFDFNYDLLVDIALLNGNKLSDSGYVLRLDYAYSNKGWQEATDQQSKVTLLKLHGSLNLLHCTNCGRNLLLRNQKDVDLARHINVSCPKCESDRYTGLERLIIPPAAVKDFGNIDIRHLWSTAEKFTSEVERIVVIGYQFAASDYELEALLRKMVMSKRPGPNVPITIVNPHPKYVADRLRSIFNGAPLTRRYTLESFLNNF
jgi:hypothetical protein